MGVSSWNILYRFQLTTPFYSALLFRCHPRSAPERQLGRISEPKGGTVCSMSEFVFGSKSASVLPALQYLEAEEDRYLAWHGG